VAHYGGGAAGIQWWAGLECCLHTILCEDVREYDLFSHPDHRKKLHLNKGVVQ
jgi:hypothetical protein